MNRLNREMPISDVYHEYNMSLGLAPPLSELLVTSAAAAAAAANHQSGASTGQPSTAANSSVTSSEDVFSSFDQISLADTVTDLSDKADLAVGLKSVTYTKRPPPRPAKHHWAGNTYQPANRHRMSVFDASSPESDVMMTTSPTTMTMRSHGGSSVLDMARRDEADGRSMTDSNYSGYSPHRNLKLTTLLPPRPPPQHRVTEEAVVKESHKSSGHNTIRAVAIIEANANNDNTP